MNPKWLKSKGVLGALGMIVTGLTMAADNIFGNTRSHDWNGIITTVATGLSLLGIRVSYGLPDEPEGDK